MTKSNHRETNQQITTPIHQKKERNTNEEEQVRRAHRTEIDSFWILKGATGASTGLVATCTEFECPAII